LFVTLGFIVLLGVPHGSLDVLFARQTFNLRYLTNWLKFINYYVAASLAVVLVWWVSPDFFLISFLILSAIHFSDDLNLIDFGIFKLLYGTSIITLPSLFFGTELINFYTILVDIEAATAIVKASQLISMIVGLTLAVVILIKKIEPRIKLEVVCVFLIFLLLNPIIAFGIYFCLMHSARHLIRSNYFLREFTKTQFFQALIYPTIAVIIMGAIVWWVGGNEKVEVGLIRIIFIGLAALTVPHAWVLKKANFQSLSISKSSKTY
jgi:Brp/Blh family beta-carotene 15,15'-monooxygenase